MRKVFNAGAMAATSGAVIAFVFCLCVFAFQYVGPALESSLLPVMKDMEFVQVNRVADEVEFSVSGRKVRQCRFKTISALSWNGTTWERSNVYFHTPNGKPNRSGRPMGQQSFGHWFTKPTGERIKFQAVYECHDLWESITDLGEVEVRP